MRTRKLGVTPRILADDILVLAQGEGHVDLFQTAFDETSDYLQSMGAKLAPDKSWTSSTSKATRKFLLAHTWVNFGRRIGVITDTRDLGAHLNLSAKANSSTLTSRLRGGTTLVRRIEMMPTDIKRKADAVKVKVHPSPLYGVETSQPNHTVLASYHHPW